eukprot:360793-Chlamydomonas_euryale.AAC.5
MAPRAHAAKPKPAAGVGARQGLRERSGGAQVLEKVCGAATWRCSSGSDKKMEVGYLINPVESLYDWKPCSTIVDHTPQMQACMRVWGCTCENAGAWTAWTAGMVDEHGRRAGWTSRAAAHKDPHFHIRGSNGQFTYGLNESMTGIVAARCGPAAAQWAVVRVGMPVKMTE